MRFGVNLPGPFWASFNVGGRRRRGGHARGPGGCLSLLLILFLWPFYLIYLVGKLFQFAWNKPSTRRGKILSVSGVSVGLLVLIIIGAATGGSSNTPAASAPTAVVAASTPAAHASTATATAKPTHRPSATPTHTHTPAPTHSAYVPPTHTAAPTYSAAPTHSAYVPPPTHTAAPAPTQAAAPSCHPTTSSGHCYEPGEFCAAKDHDDTGVAGDGKSITCEDNDGWRWED